MTLFRNGHKIGSLYRNGHKIKAVYHMGHLVYSSASTPAEPPIWDITHYNNAVAYAVEKAPLTTVANGSYAAVNTLGGTAANLYYPTCTMQGDVLIFDTTPTQNKLFLLSTPSEAWQIIPLPNGASMSLQYASKPIVDNNGNVVFVTSYPRPSKFTVDTKSKTVSVQTLANTATLTQNEILQIKWYDSPYGLTAMLVRYGIGSRTDVIRIEGSEINVVSSYSSPMTADLRYTILFPNGSLYQKANSVSTGSVALRGCAYSLLSQTGSAVYTWLDSIDEIQSNGIARNVLYNNSARKLIDMIDVPFNDGRGRIVSSNYLAASATLISPPANVTNLDGAIRTASNHFMTLDGNNQFSFAEMNTFATTRSFFTYSAAQDSARDFNNRMCVLPNGRIVFFKADYYQYTGAYTDSVSNKTACSPFFGK